MLVGQAMKVENGETADTFIISGRGALHITILIETMRREGFEFMLGPPSVITKLRCVTAGIFPPHVQQLCSTYC